jgi:serine phosphatase RsbU (regulator of sigma subunit)
MTLPDSHSRDACQRVEALIEQNRQRLIERCRKRITACPGLGSLVDLVSMHESDEWLNAAFHLFCMCVHPTGTAAAWHDQAGELHFASGLSVGDASHVLAILRDEVLELAWDAARSGSISREETENIVRTVLQAYDGALDVQTSAYVRESQRHLHRANEKLEYRQRLFERDLALAELVQRKFIPRSFESDVFRAEVRYIPTSSVGGDHAGLFPVTDQCMYVTICDVTGHGVASALVAEVVSAELRPLLKRQVDPMFQDLVPPVSIIRELNALFYREFQPLGVLLTFFVALFDHRHNSLTYAGAGHPPPLVVKADQTEIRDLNSQNIILGAAENAILESGQETIPIGAGDRVVFYTDGIIEAGDMQHRMLGLQGLRRTVSEHRDLPQADLADAILAAADRYAANNASDDMTLIVLDVLGA